MSDETKKAVAEAWARMPDKDWRDARRDVEDTLRADERARLAESLAPMPGSCGDPQCVARVHRTLGQNDNVLTFACPEDVGATRAALAVARERERAAWLERDNQVAGLRAELAAMRADERAKIVAVIRNAEAGALRLSGLLGAAAAGMLGATADEIERMP